MGLDMGSRSAGAKAGADGDLRAGREAALLDPADLAAYG